MEAWMIIDAWMNCCDFFSVYFLMPIPGCYDYNWPIMYLKFWHRNTSDILCLKLLLAFRASCVLIWSLMSLFFFFSRPEKNVCYFGIALNLSIAFDYGHLDDVNSFILDHGRFFYFFASISCFKKWFVIFIVRFFHILD